MNEKIFDFTHCVINECISISVSLCSDDGFTPRWYFRSTRRILFCWWSPLEEISRYGRNAISKLFNNIYLSSSLFLVKISWIVINNNNVAYTSLLYVTRFSIVHLPDCAYALFCRAHTHHVMRVHDPENGLFSPPNLALALHVLLTPKRGLVVRTKAWRYIHIYLITVIGDNILYLLVKFMHG